MPVQHIVWFRFREDVDSERREARAEQLRQLARQVPGIQRLEVGWNFTDRARGAQLGLIVTLDSKEALESYRVHPDHVAASKALRADTDEILAMDFEPC